MHDFKCSFVATLIKEDFSCEMAQMVTRRAGPDIACNSEAASIQCKQLFTALKGIGLPAFDAEDDLLKTPHSIYTKIQFGGLLGLAQDVENTVDLKRVDNIYQLVNQATQRYNSIKDIPLHNYVQNMVEHKTKRKRR